MYIRCPAEATVPTRISGHNVHILEIFAPCPVQLVAAVLVFELKVL